jgi:hypothetical protein
VSAPRLLLKMLRRRRALIHSSLAKLMPILREHGSPRSRFFQTLNLIMAKLQRCGWPRTKSVLHPNNQPVTGQGHRRQLADLVPYCWSVTFSIYSTLFPSSASAMAMWLIAVVAVAPCQCFSPGANQTMSPGRISSLRPPSTCTQPQPDVTISVCPNGWVCHAVRAPGSNVTTPPPTRAGEVP